MSSHITATREAFLACVLKEGFCNSILLAASYPDCQVYLRQMAVPGTPTAIASPCAQKHLQRYTLNHAWHPNCAPNDGLAATMCSPFMAASPVKAYLAAHLAEWCDGPR